MYYIGIDLGGTNIAVALVNEKAEILARGKAPTRAERPGEEVIRDMAEVCRSVLSEAGVSVEEVECAGIATPGIADPERGVVVYACNLHFHNFPIAQVLQSYIPFKKVRIANDANAAALGESIAGCGKGIANLVFITLGTGVGGGIVINHEIYCGYNFAGAELGHVVIRHNGKACSCGRKGCWESYSSATALIRQTKAVMRKHRDSVMWEMVEGDLTKVSGRTAFDAMRKQDKAGTAVVDWYLDHLADGVANMINIFQPEILCIGGGISGEKDNLLNPLRARVEKIQYGRDLEKRPQLKIAELGNDAGIIGAAALGF